MKDKKMRDWAKEVAEHQLKVEKFLFGISPYGDVPKLVPELEDELDRKIGMLSCLKWEIQNLKDITDFQREEIKGLQKKTRSVPKEPWDKELLERYREHIEGLWGELKEVNEKLSALEDHLKVNYKKRQTKEIPTKYVKRRKK